MFSSLNQQAADIKQSLPVSSSKRTQPRPKCTSKAAPLFKIPPSSEAHKPGFNGPSKTTIKDAKKPEKKLNAGGPEINLMEDFQKEMKAFVRNKEKEKQVASIRAKMSVLCSFLGCLSPFENSDPINKNCIREFISVGKSP